MKLFLFTIFLLLFSSSMSVAFAQENPRIFQVIIQIFQRDDDGNLIGYIETSDVTELNNNLMNNILNNISNETNSKIFEIRNKTIQVVTSTTELTTDPSGLLATVKFGIIDDQGNFYDAVRFSHDGFRLNPGEHLTVVWTFLRTL